MKNLLLVFSTVFFFSQCGDQSTQNTAGADAATLEPTGGQQASPSSDRTAIGAFEYWHHIKNEGQRPMPGQVVFYHYKLKKGGKILQDNFGGDPVGGIMLTEEEANKDPQAIIEGLRLMAIGDSLTIIAPSGPHPDSNYVFEIVTRGIYSR